MAAAPWARMRDRSNDFSMPADRLASAYLYYDARADDARLCLAVARTAAAHGAAIATYATLRGLGKDGNGRVTSASVEADGEQFEVRCRTVVNATGVWADEVRALDEGQDPDSIRPAKGIHITVPWSKVQADIAVVIPVPKDRRSLFIVPWGELAYVGTTDTDYDGPLDDPQCTPDDIAYVLRALNFSVTTSVTEHDVLGTWAGLRPLVKSAASGRTADLSRQHKVTRSPSNVVTVTGGKLTTYRRMAVDTVDEVMAVFERRGAQPHEPPPARRCQRLRRGRGGEPRGASERPLRQRGAGGRGACCVRSPRWPARSCPACPTWRPRRCSRPATRWPSPSTTS